MGFARQVANRVIFMDQGQIVEQNEPEEFFTQPAARAHQAVPQPDPALTRGAAANSLRRYRREPRLRRVCPTLTRPMRAPFILSRRLGAQAVIFGIMV